MTGTASADTEPGLQVCFILECHGRPDSGRPPFRANLPAAGIPTFALMNLRKLFIAVSNRHDVLYRVVLISASVLLIAFILPRQLRFRYNFRIGQPWAYADLNAPFSYPVYKSPARLESERAAIRSQHPVVYRRDNLTENSVLRRVDEQFAQWPVASRNALRQTVEQVYNRGVLAGPASSLGGRQPIRILQTDGLQSSLAGYHLQGDALILFVEGQLQNGFSGGRDSVLSMLMPLLQPDLQPQTELTQKLLDEQLALLSPVVGEVAEGSLIVRSGQVVDQEVFDRLESLRKIYRGNETVDRYRPALYTGYLVIVISALSLLLTFLWLLRRDILLDSRKLTLLILLVVGACVVYSLAQGSSKVNMMMLPLCILPLVTRAFFDTRTALFTHVLTMLILGAIASGGYEFVFMQVTAGMVAIFSIVNMNRRSQLFLAAGLILMAYLVSFFGLTLINEGRLDAFHLPVLIWLLVNALLTLLAYPLIFFIEKSFGVTSDFTLMELTDFNSELLREMSLKAPGTFQHSLQVANLAEAAIFRIGGNSLLVRAGALYHDIGKTELPMYFIENQSTLVNPHDELSFDESASIITSHVIRGIEKARRHKLPDVIIDFIRTHHGTMRVQYFYNSFIKSFPDQVPNEDAFRYPGPRPFSKETAVLMMADSVEATARSLAQHDAASLDEVVERTIRHQMEAGQFENCDITFRDLTVIKKIFKKMLASIYHVRIAYPG